MPPVLILDDSTFGTIILTRDGSSWTGSTTWNS